MTDEGTCISQPELKQATKGHGLTVWQQQWDISEKGEVHEGSLPQDKNDSDKAVHNFLLTSV